MEYIYVSELTPGMRVADSSEWSFEDSENYMPVISVKQISEEHDAWLVTLLMFDELREYLKFGQDTYELPRNPNEKIEAHALDSLL